MYLPVRVPAASCSGRRTGGRAGQQVDMVHKRSDNSRSLLIRQPAGPADHPIWRINQRTSL